jgi:PAS domain S-box-containing protein
MSSRVPKIRHESGASRLATLPVGAGSLDLGQHLDALLNASFDGFLVVGADATVLRLNKAYTRITGFGDELVGQDIRLLLRKGVLRHSVTLEVIKHRIPITMMHQYPTGNVALVTGTPVFDRDGNLALVIVNVRDITQLNALRERLGDGAFLGEANSSIFLRPELADLPTFGLVVHSEPMRRCLMSALKVAKYDSPVLILGESGVGKGRLAKLIHDASPHRDGPFVHLNCGAIPESLIESELFGYERGAFTGALPSGKMGQFELADKGTMFLDEVAELGTSLQVKLLNVIEGHVVHRIGGRRGIPIDVRLIAATNRDLDSRVREGRFREDLYFRLNVVPITIPPLRERRDDIPIMIRTFLDALVRKYGVRKRLTSEVLQVLNDYHYPGNVRELENILERLVILSEGEEIEERHLALSAATVPPPRPPAGDGRGRGLREALETYEAQLLKHALLRGHTLRALAAELGVSVPTLWRKLRKHRLQTQRVLQAE